MRSCVILDADTVTNGDISFEPISSLVDARLIGLTVEGEVADNIADAELVITNKVKITDEVMSRCKNLKYIGLFATGYNNIDIEAAKKRGIVVSNVPGYSTSSVAQHTFALILHYFQASPSTAGRSKTATGAIQSSFPISTFPSLSCPGRLSA